MLELRERETSTKILELVHANSELEGDLLLNEEELDQMDLKVATLTATVEKLTMEKSTWEDAMKAQHEEFRQRLLLEEASSYHSSVTCTSTHESSQSSSTMPQFMLEVRIFSNFVTQQLQMVLQKVLQQPHLAGTTISTLRQISSVATQQISIKTARYQLDQTEVNQLPDNAQGIVRQLEEFIAVLEMNLEKSNQMFEVQKSQLLEERSELETENAVLEGDLTRFEDACKQQEDELMQVEAQRDNYKQLWEAVQTQVAEYEDMNVVE